ncbi:hypothetical protein HS048_17225 [Planomonospora sp. ID91781]|uniref:hypothetical protein n=1 Tax=Planomonospora sp. ID91781 TaxID=2738135 RepID=UPI0018C3DDBA|nr:hypothetical protein [Planomonospora sp. ID91781]MBG0822484.1 hypothetical protein [Planomonospora sp. ID91781]
MYVTGSHRRLFDEPTTTRPDSHRIVFSLRDLPEELKAACSPREPEPSGSRSR